MNKGFLVVANNTDDVDYVKCATVLAHSIKHVMHDANISIVTNDDVVSDIFDNVVRLPYGDNANPVWKLSNDWQVYECSPYEHTIKLESDMYIPRSIDHWWEILKNRDLHICTTIRNYYNEISYEKYYRSEIYDNYLPDTYNGITYFKKSKTSERFFNLVKHIFENWQEYRGVFNKLGDVPTTDIVYGIASSIIGIEHSTIPSITDISMIHMKPKINNNVSSDWTIELLYEIVKDDTNILRVNSSTINYPFHYHIKHFVYELEKELYGSD